MLTFDLDNSVRLEIFTDSKSHVIFRFTQTLPKLVRNAVFNVTANSVRLVSKCNVYNDDRYDFTKSHLDTFRSYCINNREGVFKALGIAYSPSCSRFTLTDSIDVMRLGCKDSQRIRILNVLKSNNISTIGQLVDLYNCGGFYTVKGLNSNRALIKRWLVRNKLVSKN